MNSYFYYDSHLCYPKISPYMPGKLYPEYPYDDFYLASEQDNANEIYEAIRNLFILLQLDGQNIGKRGWNPLGEYIQPGQTVLLKPNLVSHCNPAEKDLDKGMDCLITHPSLVRVIFDYVYIALKGKGRIIIADAPVQGCDFEQLLQNTGYGALMRYLMKKVTSSVTIQIADLREVTYTQENGKKIQRERKNPEFGSKTIDLKDNSFFAKVIRKKGFRVTCYAGKDTDKCHRHSCNQYKVSDAMLEADVIINIPKPKTHRIAGYTAALKNMIGINARKECLPHHQKGAKGRGGDEYTNTHNVLKWFNSTGNDIRNYAIKKDWQIIAFLSNEVCRRIGRKLDKYEPDRKKSGMWYGNDTIWRTILDVNHIVYFADKNGIMCEQQQRKILNIGDMVVCGDHEGPLRPSYKQIGGILFSEHPVIFDFFAVKLMGFKWDKFPVLVNAIKDRMLMGELLHIVLKREEDDKKYVQSVIKKFRMYSNAPEFNKTIDEISDEHVFRFIPTKGWIEYL